MAQTARVARGMVLCGAVGMLLLTVSYGCKKEEEPTPPGYYTGPITPKGQATPNKGPANSKAGATQKGGSSQE